MQQPIFNSIQDYLYSFFHETIVAKQLYRKWIFYNTNYILQKLNIFNLWQNLVHFVKFDIILISSDIKFGKSSKKRDLIDIIDEMIEFQSLSKKWFQKTKKFITWAALTTLYFYIKYNKWNIPILLYYMKSSTADIFLKFSFWYLGKKAKKGLDWQRWVNDDIFNFEVNNSFKTKISEKTNPPQNQTHQCLNSSNKVLIFYERLIWWEVLTVLICYIDHIWCRTRQGH